MNILIQRLINSVRHKKTLRAFYLRLKRFAADFIQVYYKLLKFFLERIALLIAILNGPIRDTSIHERRDVLVIISKGKGKKSDWTNYDYFHFLGPFEEFMKKHKTPISVWLIDENPGFLGLIRFLRFLFQNSFRTVVLSSWNPSEFSVGSPSPFIFRRIKKRMSKSVRFVILGWDTVTPKFWDRHLSLEFLDEIVLLENPISLGFMAAKNFNKLLILPNFPLPMNTINLAEYNELSRNIDVTFFGQVNSYRDYRAPFLEVLEKYQNTSFISASKSGTSDYTYSEMFETMRKSKFGVNFSRSADDREQLKGRVWEVLLSGALLLEQKNSQILQFFEPGKHFIFFESPSELEKHIDYYMHHEKERREIAEEGMKRARNLQMQDLLFRHLLKN